MISKKKLKKFFKENKEKFGDKKNNAIDIATALTKEYMEKHTKYKLTDKDYQILSNKYKGKKNDRKNRNNIWRHNRIYRNKLHNNTNMSHNIRNWNNNTNDLFLKLLQPMKHKPSTNTKTKKC